MFYMSVYQMPQMGYLHDRRLR